MTVAAFQSEFMSLFRPHVITVPSWSWISFRMSMPTTSGLLLYLDASATSEAIQTRVGNLAV